MTHGHLVCVFYCGHCAKGTSVLITAFNPHRGLRGEISTHTFKMRKLRQRGVGAGSPVTHGWVLGLGTGPQSGV